MYTILGVKTTGSQKEIKQSYYKMAKKYHPDFQPKDLKQSEVDEAAEMFKKVQKAYEVLKNPISR